MSELATTPRARLDADVGVVGLGTVGTMTLWRLAHRGVRAVGLEQFTVPHADAAYGGDTRLFRLAYREGPQYHHLLTAARDLWLELNARSGHDVFVECGALSIGPESSEYITELLSSAHDRTPLTRLTAAETSARFPVFRLDDSDVALLDPHGGVLRSDRAVREAVRLATGLGARARDRTAIEEIRPHGDHVEVVAGDGTWRFAQVVVTTGAWSRRLPMYRDVPVTVKRVQLGWHLAADPASVAPDRMPVFVRDDGLHHLYGAPTTDGSTIKIAGLPAAQVVTDPVEARRPPSADRTAQEAALVEEWFAGVDPQVVRAECYADLYTPDGAPLLGRDPRWPRIIHAVGFSGRGFKYAPAAGDLLARACLDREVLLPTFAAASRFGPTQTRKY